MKTKKIVSLLLAVLMACSVFAGLTVSAEDATHTYTVVGDASFLGAQWTPASTADDMTLREDGTYYKAYENPAAGTVNLKVAEDHAWNVSFGATIDNNQNNIEVIIPENAGKVEVILHVEGTREVEIKDEAGNVTGTEVQTAAYVEILVDGAAPEVPTQPEETFHVVAGDAALCNGIEWTPADKTNEMKLVDGVYEITFENIPAGTYNFKVTTNGKWDVADFNLVGDAKFGGPDAVVEVTETQAPAKVKVTFKEEEQFARAYINDVEVEVERDVEPTTKETEVVDDKGNTSAITYGAGYYTPATGTDTKRIFFKMPKSWYTFNNATAGCYWWAGTDTCETWQMGYRMKSSGLEDVYYLDIPFDVPTLVFNNGIDGGSKPTEDQEASANWGKNYQTKDVPAEYYDIGDSENYPQGTKTFNNMVFVVDEEHFEENAHSGAKAYFGEWMALHADGTIDFNVVDGVVADPYEVKGIDVRLDKTTASVTVGKTVTLKPSVTQALDTATTTWTSSDEKVATVDANGVVKAVAKGTATITCTVANPVAEGATPDEATATCKITVTQPVTSVKVTGAKTIYNGKTLQLKATVAPTNADNKTVKWTSSNAKIAKVDAKGKVTAVKPGTVTITATAASGVKGTAKITVKAQKATKVTVAKTAKIAKKGKKVAIVAKVAPTNTYNKKINVTTDKKGKKIVKIETKSITSGKKASIKGLKKGKAKVTFTAADGSKKKAVCTVTVKK